MFDRVRIRIKAGGGGSGSASFRHEKYVPFGGPDGGDGGDGGDIIFSADATLNDLDSLGNNRLYRAQNGGNGRGKKMAGKRGEPLRLRVPVGTMVFTGDAENDLTFLADLKEAGEEVVAVRGGRGGRGNVHFASSTNQAPESTEPGRPGEIKFAVLEMRLIADCGIIGYPNAGKSTLLSRISHARPKIADYPFTTREPVLGVVTLNNESFVAAEIPGLIDGAHLGRGLGHDFLRHAMRTRAFIHLIDGNSASPVADMLRINTELELFDRELARKPQLVAVNKIDLPQVASRLESIRISFAKVGARVFFISASSGKGVPELVCETVKLLRSVPPRETPKSELPVLRPVAKGRNRS
ncbi:MAG: GTPase ObgE [Chloroflexota bacterium]